jgi:hypothetical protein
MGSQNHRIYILTTYINKSIASTTFIHTIKCLVYGLKTQAQSIFLFVYVVQSYVHVKTRIFLHKE